MKYRLLLLLVTNFLMTGCPLQTRDDIQKEDEEKQLKEQVSSIQKSKADNDSRYNDLQNELRAVGGRIDAVDHNQVISNQNTQKEIESLKKLVEAQNDKIKMIEQHIDATETRLTAAIQAVATAAPPAPVPAPQTAAGGKDKPTAGIFGEAEDLFAKKDFKHAIIKYQAYRDKNPKGSKNSESTYKIGVCFAELGQKKDAKDFYQETIDSYPNSASAKKAKLRLSQMK